MPQSVFCTTRRRWPLTALVLAALVTATAVFAGSCQSDAPDGYAEAYQTTHRDQLIGGPGALGEVGDWVIENDEIRLVVQNTTFNRGTGLFGGSLIDADLVRQDGEGDPFGGNGRDTFGEAFPAFFLEVIDPQEIVVVDPAEMDRDDIDEDAAVLEVRGDGGEFVTMLRFFNHAMVKAYHPELLDLVHGNMPDSDGTPLVQFTARYILEPGARHVRLESEMKNTTTGRTLDIPMDFEQLLDDLSDFIEDEDNAEGGDGGLMDFIDGIDFDAFTVPTGWALGFGAMNNQFMPGMGYDIRFGLEDLYAEQDIDLPAIPGHITDVLATSSTDGISYGFATAPSSDNFVYNKPEYYGDDVTDRDMLFLFEAAGYGGAFTHEIVDELGPGETYVAENYFIVGSGDVASIRDEAYQIHELETETVTGRIYDEVTGEPADRHANFFVYEPHPEAEDDERCTGAEPGQSDPEPIIINQAHTNSDGYFEFQLPAGEYCYRTQMSDGLTSDFHEFEVDSTTSIQAPAPSTGRVEAMIVDGSGNPIPAKMTLVGEYDPIPGLATREYLFDLTVGERWRTSESVDFDADDDSPRQFIENIEFSGADGRTGVDVAPGEYTAYFSRGAEYGLTEKNVVVEPGAVTRVNAEVKRQINPDGYLSGDFHMHAAGSIDSGLDYNDRVVSIAGEGVEVVVASDHNYISDFSPYIYRNNLQPFLRSIIGLELTTMEAGHFNAFPLRHDITSPNRGSVAWQNIPPQQIFDDLRDMGSIGPDDTIVQVNHPRDSILGYFNQHYLDGMNARAELPINSVERDDEALFDADLAMAAALSPSGPAFADTCPGQTESGYCSAFSYDFDAIEVFNGKRLHLLRHFRVPDHDELSDEAIAELFDGQVTVDRICGHPDIDAATIADILGDDFDEDDIDVDDCTGDDFDADDFEPADFDAQVLTDLLPTEGAVLCDDDDVAYPGGLDDWYNFLNVGQPDGEYRPYTATTNSDSHHYGSPDDPEPGFPKNYFWVGHNDPRQMEPVELVEALKNHHNIPTNGPFINMSIEGEPVGSTVAIDGDEVTLELEAEAADWVIGDEGLEYTIVANGEPIEEGDLEFEDNRWSDTVIVDLDDHDIHFAESGVRDTWFVLEVEGENNLFPVTQPAEIPQVPFDEALGAIAEPFGFGDTVEGLAPREKTDIHPVAFTNPIWVIDDQDGSREAELDEFELPNLPPQQCQPGGPDAAPTELRVDLGDRRLDAESVDLGIHDHGDLSSALIKREQGELRDVRALFNHWHDH